MLFKNKFANPSFLQCQTWKMRMKELGGIMSKINENHDPYWLSI